jgi:hypothetical protein
MRVTARLIAALLLALPMATLVAATAEDLIGTWRADPPATWARLAGDPGFAARLSVLPPDLQAYTQSRVLARLAPVACTVDSTHFILTGTDGTAHDFSGRSAAPRATCWRSS